MEMPAKCDQADTYTGEGRPKCYGGNGCIQCWATHNKYLDDHRPPFSPDFQEFYDYLCKYKRVMQAGRLGKDDLPSETLYEWINDLERSIRTGKYRHHLINLERVLVDMNSGR